MTYVSHEYSTGYHEERKMERKKERMKEIRKERKTECSVRLVIRSYQNRL